MQTIIDQHNKIFQSLSDDEELDYIASVETVIDKYNNSNPVKKSKSKSLLFNILRSQSSMREMSITEKTKVEDIYWIDDDDKNVETRDDIIRNFDNIVNNKPLVNHYQFDKCQYCGNEMCVNNNDGIIVCDKCGNVERILIESEIPSYKDSGADKPIYPYKRLNHFMECINQFQAKENINIPDEVYDKIIKCFKRKRINDFKSLSLNDVRDVLKSLKMNKYYEHVSFIYSKISGNPPPRLTYTEENKLKTLFKKVDKSFIKYCPKDRSNFFNYNYLLHKLFRIMNMEQYLIYFPLLKSKEKLMKQEEIWKLVCKDIGVEFVAE